MSNHVKIYGVKPRIQYTADGTSTTYEFQFAIVKTSDIDTEAGEKQLKRTEAIVLSMTPAERANPKLMNPKRKFRIAKGAGVDIADVNRFIKQFEQSQKMMKQLPGMMGKHGKRGFGGLGGFPF